MSRITLEERKVRNSLKAHGWVDIEELQNYYGVSTTQFHKSMETIGLLKKWNNYWVSNILLSDIVKTQWVTPNGSNGYWKTPYVYIRKELLDDIENNGSSITEAIEHLNQQKADMRAEMEQKYGNNRDFFNSFLDKRVDGKVPEQAFEPYLKSNNLEVVQETKRIYNWFKNRGLIWEVDYDLRPYECTLVNVPGNWCQDCPCCEHGDCKYM